MRVLLFLPAAARWRGGCEHYALEICAGLCAAGHTVTACLPLSSAATRFTGALGAAGAALEPWPLPAVGGWGEFATQWRLAAALLERVAPDAALAALPWPDSGLGLMKACVTLQVPTVVVFQLVSALAGPPTPARREAALALDAGQVWVAVSEDNRAHVARAFGVAPDRLEVIYNGVGAVPARVRANGPPVALTVARLSAGKGHLDLLRAAVALRDRHPQLRYAWAGDGEQGVALTAAVTASAVADRVQLLGWRDDVPRLLRDARLMVLPTHEEGASFALLESMAAGTPVVASNASSNGELVRHGTDGLLFPAGDPEALASALDWALTHEDEMGAMAASARARARTVFSEREMIAGTVARLEQAAS